MCGICGVVQFGGPLWEVVPESVLERRKVGFFNAQVGRFVERSAAADRERLLDPGSRLAPLIDPAGLDRLIRDRRLPRLHLALGLLDRWPRDALRRSLQTPDGIAA